ncbi:DUF1456 family protein [Bdellovibrionota bacterium FG-2]
MLNNDVLRMIRYMMNISDTKLIEITKLAGLEVSTSEITSFLKKDDEEGYQECPHRVMAHFLNGLVLFKRGKDESRPPQPIETPVTNNLVLKRLRVAFELQDSAVIALIEKSGLKVTKSELSAFFRKQGHRNYRECGDQFLRNLIKGMTP